MPTPSSGPSGFDDQETSLGGADAVPDTQGVPAHGTEPNQRRSGTTRARVSSGSGLSSAAWVAVVLVALLVLLIYGGGFLR